MTPTYQEIEGSIIDMLKDMTSDWDLELESLDGTSRLSADFCFSSVDMLDLMAKVDMRYKRKLRYDQLLIRNGSYVTDLSVGELASFVHDRFDEVHDAAPRAM